MNCEFCQSAVHIWFDCPKKPKGWKPARLAKKSQDSSKVEQRLRECSNVTTEDNSPILASDMGHSESMGPGERKMMVAPQGLIPASGTKYQEPDATPAGAVVANTSGVTAGETATKFDKKAWMRNYMVGYMRTYRAKKKEAGG